MHYTKFFFFFTLHLLTLAPALVPPINPKFRTHDENFGHCISPKTRAIAGVDPEVMGMIVIVVMVIIFTASKKARQEP